MSMFRLSICCNVAFSTSTSAAMAASASCRISWIPSEMSLNRSDRNRAALTAAPNRASTSGRDAAEIPPALRLYAWSNARQGRRRRGGVVGRGGCGRHAGNRGRRRAVIGRAAADHGPEAAWLRARHEAFHHDVFLAALRR